MSTAEKFRVLPLVALVACSSAPRQAGGTGGEDSSTGGSTGSGGASMTSSLGGTVGTGGASAADASTTTSDADNPSSTGGASGSDASSPGPDPGGTAAGPFTCNQLVGPSPMFQWFNGGFLKHPGIDPTKWQLISVAHHYTDAWAKPGDPAWNTALDGGH